MAIGERSDRSQVTLLDTSNWNAIHRIPGTPSAIFALQFSSDGRRIFGGGVDNVIRGWDVDTGRLVFTSRAEGAITSIALSPDGRTLAVACYKDIRLFPTMPAAWSTPGRAAEILQEHLDRSNNATWRESVVRAATLHPETLKELIRLRPDDVPLKFAYAESLTSSGDKKKAASVLASAEAACSNLAVIKDDESLANAYADALQTRVFDESQWHALREFDVEIDGEKRTPHRQDSGLLVGGGQEEYTIHAKCPVSKLQSVRVELVPELGAANQHEPFSLHELQAFLDRGDGEPPHPIQLRFGGDRHDSSSELHNVVDNDPLSFWNCGSASRGAQWAVFSSPDIVDTATGELTFVIKTGSSSGFRRLRLSVTDQPVPQTPLNVAWMSGEGRGLLTDFVRLSVAFYLAGDFDKAHEALEIAKTQSDESVWSHEILESLIRWQQGDSDASKRVLQAARRPRPYWVHPVECQLMQLALTQIDSVDDESASLASRQFMWYCRRAFLTDPIVDRISDLNLDYKVSVSLVASERWYEAALYIEGYVRTGKDAHIFPWMAAATLHAYAARNGQGNVDDYRRSCSAMIERFVEPDVETTRQIMKCCLLLPDNKVNLDRLAIVKLSEAWSRGEGNRAWLAMTLAMAAYRDQRNEDALDFAGQIAGLEPWSNAIKSLAFSSQGKTAEARKALDAARAALKRYIEYFPDESVVGESVVPRGVIVHDLLIADLLIREATEALRKAL